MKILDFSFVKKWEECAQRLPTLPLKRWPPSKRKGGGGEWQAVVTGIKDLSKFIFTGNNISMIVYEGGLFSWKKVFFFGKGSFLCSRGISMEEAYFYGGGIFLQQRRISTAEANF